MSEKDDKLLSRVAPGRCTVAVLSFGVNANNDLYVHQTIKVPVLKEILYLHNKYTKDIVDMSLYRSDGIVSYDVYEGEVMVDINLDYIDKTDMVRITEWVRIKVSEILSAIHMLYRMIKHEDITLVTCDDHDDPMNTKASLMNLARLMEWDKDA